MKYQVKDGKDYLFIELSGETRANEALLVKKKLAPYFKKKGISVIVDFQKLSSFEPVSLMGVLNSFKKEVELSRGELKLRSLKPEIALYLKETNLDRIFQLCDDT